MKLETMPLNANQKTIINALASSFLYALNTVNSPNPKSVEDSYIAVCLFTFYFTVG